MIDPRRRAFVWAIFVLALLAGLSIVPTPFYLVSPGSAIELSTRIAVEGHAPPARHFYLTDVSVVRASILLLAAALWPGVRVVRRDVLFPQGANVRGYDDLLIDAMTDSQHIAAYVAERAAGYRLASPREQVFVAQVLPDSRAGGALQSGDRLLRIGGRNVGKPGDVLRAEAAAHDELDIAIERAGSVRHINVPLVATPGGPRLGILIRDAAILPVLPVPVHFSFGDVSGSSGGLMFALEIYDTLAGGRAGGTAVAGTGTIASDGTIGPVEGVRQKLIAAQRAGAALFFVPKENYADVAGETALRVVPVGTFAEALAALR